MKINYLFKEKVPKCLFKIMSNEEKEVTNKMLDTVLTLRGLKYLFIIATFSIPLIGIWKDNSIIVMLSLFFLLFSIITDVLEEKAENKVARFITDLIVSKDIVKEVNKEWNR